MVNLNTCDHQRFYDVYSGKTFLTCFCFCDKCYSHEAFRNEGNGCIDEECFCRDESMPPSVIDVTHREDVVADLPENPGKTGTCRKCKDPTYRKGDRGRFPVLCEDCK